MPVPSRLLALVCGLTLLAGGCTGRPAADRATASSATQSATASASSTGPTSLAPTGVELFGGGQGPVGLVVDGSGAAWVTGPWQLSRVDPATGSGLVWNGSADAALFEIQATAGSAGAGVWILGPRRLRLFDGERYAQDVAVPTKFTSADLGAVRTMAVQGETVWLDTPQGVLLHLVSGAWQQVARQHVMPTVDATGALWTFDTASGRLVRRVGNKWVSAGKQSPSRARPLRIVADPRKGLWVLGDQTVYRFDGAKWSQHRLPRVRSADGTVSTMYATSLAAAGAGVAWVSSQDSAARLSSSGKWTIFQAGQGVSTTPAGYSSSERQIAVLGKRVLLTDALGLLRLDGKKFARIWNDPAAAPIRAGWTVQAVSADEVWVQAHKMPIPRPAPPWQLSTTFAHLTKTGWDTSGPVALSRAGSVVAPDGSLWATTSIGLARHTAAGWTTIDKRLTRGPVAVDPQGTVWALAGSRLVQFDQAGKRTIGLTPLGSKLSDSLLTSALGGVVWVGSNSITARPTVARWDGKWTKVQAPAWTQEILAAPDGSLWAAANDNNERWLLRYADGRWKEVAGSRKYGPTGLVVSPLGDVCAVVSDLVCFDASGLTSRTVLPQRSNEASIARDGATWVVGEQVAKLPTTWLPWSGR